MENVPGGRRLVLEQANKELKAPYSKANWTSLKKQ
jgi:hypothetical protein